jgi:hypothetical protein
MAPVTWMDAKALSHFPQFALLFLDRSFSDWRPQWRIYTLRGQALSPNHLRPVRCGMGNCSDRWHHLNLRHSDCARYARAVAGSEVVTPAADVSGASSCGERF